MDQGHRILCGIETEYGITLEGRGPEDQITDVAGLVECAPGHKFVGWDYRDEHPRRDLRGFSVDRLATDPTDSKFDKGRPRPSEMELRRDRITSRGARFYNDHGHPEYATPECWSPGAVALEDLLGEHLVAQAARGYEVSSGRPTRVYKNNTDFHGASYGTHESYLLPRVVEFKNLARVIIPMLVARPLLCGAGKVGSESGAPCAFQLSQRADFFMETVNVETLFRRPIFNTRDEPHAGDTDFIRLHVIAGDANRILSCTARKVFLVQIALRLLLVDQAPSLDLQNPVLVAKTISRDLTFGARIDLEGGGWTTARSILDAYLGAARVHLVLSHEDAALLDECEQLLSQIATPSEEFSRHVDWAAKKRLVDWVSADEGYAAGSPEQQSIDLEYAHVNPPQSLFDDLAADGFVAHSPLPSTEFPLEATRALARAIAIQRFLPDLTSANWRTLTFGRKRIELRPDRCYESIRETQDVVTFMNQLEDINA